MPRVPDGQRWTALQRVLWIIRLLDDTWQEEQTLAIRLSVCTRTIRRDIAALRSHGFTFARQGRSGYAMTRWKLTSWPDHYNLSRRRHARV